MASFTVVGTGTGTEQYIIPLAREVIEEADVLIGGARNLEPWKNNKELYYIKPPLENIIDLIKEHYQKKKVVILVSGDPGFYSLLNFLLKHFSKEELKVVPGISSMQIAFARLALPWHDAVLLNLHGRPINILADYLNSPKIALLTDPQNNPELICRYLINKVQNNCTIHICANLGYPNENIQTFKLQEFADQIFDNLGPAVMVIIND